MFLGGIFISAIRFDLFRAQLWSAFLMVLISLPVYILGNITSPEAITSFWILPGFATQKIIGIPIGDILWYALLGFFLGGIIEYVFDYRLADKKGPPRAGGAGGEAGSGGLGEVIRSNW